MGRHRQIPDPTPGAAFGDWTVVGPAPTLAKRPHERRTRCRCRCGVVQVVCTTDLVRGRTTRCLGCARDATNASARSRAMTVKPERRTPR